MEHYDPLNPNPDEFSPNDRRPAIGQNGEHIARIEFDYSEIDAGLVDSAHLARECSDLCPIAKRIAAEQTAELFNRILEWVWQRQPKPEGLEIRAAIVCWVFLPWLKPKTMSQIAAACGERDKQSLGRWVDEFKRDFPTVKTSHMSQK